MAPEALPFRLILALIILIAAAVRLPGLDQAPPGLHQDEAVNAWNAWCLLKTGQDQVGVPWPLFYMRALGGNRTAMYAYLLLPFQAVGGLNLWTTRLPAAVVGVLTVPLIYWVAARMFSRETGLIAAVLLAVNPVHIQMSRFGSETSLTPTLTLIPLALLLWAGLPFGDDAPRARPARSLIAGLLTGVTPYGYAAVRLFTPIFLTASTVATWRGWRELARSPAGRRALVGLALGVAVTFGPLAYRHITDPEGIGRRGRMTWIWSSADSWPTRMAKVAERYGQHYLPGFLLLRGDFEDVVWTTPFGFLPLYLVPLVVAGGACCVGRLRSSRAARVAMIGILLYPVGDAMNNYMGPHALRSSAGLFPWLLVAAVGPGMLLAFLRRRRLQAMTMVTALAVVGLLIPETARFARSYFHERDRQLRVYQGTHRDLLAACDWLRPRLADVDAVICYAPDLERDFTPYITMVVALQHDPRAWLAEPRVMEPTNLWDRYTRCGKFYFVDGAEREALLTELRGNDREDRVVLLLRPEEPAPAPPTAEIIGPDGKPALLIYDLRL